MANNSESKSKKRSANRAAKNSSDEAKASVSLEDIVARGAGLDELIESAEVEDSDPVQWALGGLEVAADASVDGGSDATDQVRREDMDSGEWENFEAQAAENFDSNPDNQLELEDSEPSADGDLPQMAGEVFEEAGADEMGAASQADDVDAEADAHVPTEFIEFDHVVSIIESLLFATDRPVSVSTMKQIFKGSNIRSKDLQRALDVLASEYASATRGVTLEEINGGYQLRTKVDNADYLRRLSKVRPFKLSGPALEVLAIVAYRQPIIKNEVDQIRGVESGHLVRALMERGLVNFVGKSDLPGKPMQYGTTRRFLEIFGLRNIRELPTLAEIDDLIPEGIGDVEEKDVRLSDLTESLSETVKSSYSEGEDELMTISGQLEKIDTSSEFFEQEKIRQREKRDRDRAQNLREALVMNEAVDPKDKKWLERYDRQMELAAEKARMIAAGEISAESSPSEDGAAASKEESGSDMMSESSVESIHAASDESMSDDDVVDSGSESERVLLADEYSDELESDDEPESDEDSLDDDELAANPDWDEDHEAHSDTEEKA